MHREEGGSDVWVLKEAEGCAGHSEGGKYVLLAVGFQSEAGESFNLCMFSDK